MLPLKDETLGQVLLALGLALLLLLIPGLFAPEGPAPLRVLFGWGSFGVVATCLTGGLLLVFAPKLGWKVRWQAVILGELIFLVLMLVLHLGIEGSLDAAIEGEGGGLVGWAFSQLLLLVLPISMAWVVAWLLLFGTAFFFVRSLPDAWSQAIRRWLSSGVRAFRTWSIGLISSFSLRSPQSIDTDGSLVDDELDEQQVAASSKTSVTQSGIVESKADKKKRAAPRRRRSKNLPPLDLLRPGETGSGSYADSRQRAQVLQQTLAEFGVPVEVVSIKEGPRVTQFGLEPGEIIRELRSGEIRRRRVPVASILRLSNDIALALAAPSLRIEAPVPGRPYVGVEVPNNDHTLVSLRDVLETREFKRLTTPLIAALGRGRLRRSGYRRFGPAATPAHRRRHGFR